MPVTEMFTPPDGPYLPLDTGTDGLPVEHRARKLALRLLVNGTTQSKFGFDPVELVRSSFARPSDRIAAWGVMLALVASGRVDNDGSVAVFTNNPDFTPGTPQENFLASARGIGDRLGTSRAGKEKAAAMFARIRTVYGAHCRTVPTGACLVVPLAITLRDGEAECSRAIVVHRHARGVQLLEAGPDAFLDAQVDPDGVRAPDVALCLPWPDEQGRDALLHSTISPFTSVGDEFSITVARLAKDALRSVRPLAADAAAAIGDDIAPNTWTSFMCSLMRAGNLKRLIKAKGFASLDPAVRAAAMRDPLATYADYIWMAGPDDIAGLRRRQASAVIPVFVRRLRAIQNTIDDGGQLMPALSARTRIPVPVLRRMSGLTWQRLGRHYKPVLEGESYDPFASLMAVTPLQSMPRDRKEWILAIDAAGTLRNHIGHDIPASVALAASRDRGAFAEVISKDAFRAVSQTAEILAKAASGYWHDHLLVDDALGHAAARVLLSRLVGSDGGLKRLHAFNDAWHRHQPWITANIANLRRRIAGAEQIRWHPLSKQGFAHEYGKLEWLCTDTALAFEGASMQHCVGSYVMDCARGDSHIASIRANDGSRSTAELTVSENGMISVRQHRSFENGVPGPWCHEVLVGFVKAANKRRGVRLNLRAIAKARKSFMSGPGVPGSIKLDPADAEFIVRLFDPCLGKLGRNKDVSDWREAFRQDALDFPPEPAPHPRNDLAAGAAYPVPRVEFAFL